MIAVIGCGNLNRTDDGVGSEVVRCLGARDRLRTRNDVQLLDAGTDGMAVMFAARGCTTLIVVDSCRTGAEPAAVFTVPGAEVAQPHEASLNLHDFRWDHAIYSGKKIFREAFPSDVTAYLIEARSVELGVGLSEDVRAAAERVADMIEERILASPAPAQKQELQ